MRRRGAYLVGIVALLLVVGLRVFDPGPVRQLRLSAFDTFQTLAPRAYQPADVRIVAIDEASLNRLGQWPWPRTVLADLVKKLDELGATVVAFDSVFAEADRTAPDNLLDAWTRHDVAPEVVRSVRRLPDPDAVFAKAIAEASVVTGFAPGATGSPRPPARPAGFAFSGAEPLDAVARFRTATTNLPILTEGAAGNGSFTIINDTDSVVRRAPLLHGVNGTIYPSLSAEALRVAASARSHVVKSSSGSGEREFGAESSVVRLRIGPYEIPTTGDGSVMLYDTGPKDARYVSAWRVLNPGEHDTIRDRIRGHIVFVGATASGLKDIRASPLSPAVPGVSIHAQATEQMRLGTFLRRPDWASAVELAVLVLIGGALVLALPRMGAAWSAVAGGLAVIACIGLAWGSFDRLGWLFDPVFPAAGALAVYVPTTVTMFVLTEREKRFIRSAFSHYLSPALVERLTRQPEALNLGGENRELTIMFTDIRGFTPVAETMTSDELTTFMNRFLTPMTQDILDHAGFVDKYMGDAIMAFWNAPVETPDHADHACGAALAMRASLVSLNRAWREEFAAAGRHFPGIAVGIGLHTGVCCVGNVGSQQRFDYSALGDSVNLASRLEGQSKTYGVDIVVSEATRSQAGGEMAFLELDLIRVKGRREPARIFTLVGDGPLSGDPDWHAFESCHRAMLEAYRRQAWDEADAARLRCAETLAEGPSWLPTGVSLDTLYVLYGERIAALRADPPPADWDAVFTAQTK